MFSRTSLFNRQSIFYPHRYQVVKRSVVPLSGGVGPFTHFSRNHWVSTAAERLSEGAQKKFPNHFISGVDRSTFDPSYFYGTEQTLASRKALVEESFAAILRKIDIPYWDPESGSLKKEGFFQKLEEVVHRYDPGAKVFVSGGTIRNLFGFLYEELYFAHQKGNQSPEEILRKIASSEYLFRDSKDFVVSKLASLGIGSDLDILIEFSETFHAKESVLKEACEFINCLPKKLPDSPFKDILAPFADVREYQTQINRAVSQGGSALDWLAFPLSPKSGTSFITPPQYPDIVDHILQGKLPFLPTTNAESKAKTTIRAVRSLFEVPCLEMDSVGEDLFVESVDDVVGLPELGHETAQAIRNVCRKALLNVRIIEAINECAVIDEKSSRVMRTLHGMSRKLSSQFPLIPELVPHQDIEGRKEDFDPGDFRKIGALISPADFSRQYTDNGKLYHGTPHPENFFSMIRGSLVVSSEQKGREQGIAVCGRGFYTTSSYGIALGYADKNGVVLSFPVTSSDKLRVMSLSDFQDRFPSKYEEIQDAASEQNMDIHEYLFVKYAVDIILREHVLVQNAQSLIFPRTVERFLLSNGPGDHLRFYMEQMCRFVKESLDIGYLEKSFSCYLKNYETLLLFSDFYPLPDTELWLEKIEELFRIDPFPEKLIDFLFGRESLVKRLIARGKIPLSILKKGFVISSGYWQRSALVKFIFQTGGISSDIQAQAFRLALAGGNRETVFLLLKGLTLSDSERKAAILRCHPAGMFMMQDVVLELLKMGPLSVQDQEEIFRYVVPLFSRAVSWLLDFGSISKKCRGAVLWSANCDSLKWILSAGGVDQKDKESAILFLFRRLQDGDFRSDSMSLLAERVPLSPKFRYQVLKQIFKCKKEFRWELLFLFQGPITVPNDPKWSESFGAFDDVMNIHTSDEISWHRPANSSRDRVAGNVCFPYNVDLGQNLST